MGYETYSKLPKRDKYFSKYIRLKTYCNILKIRKPLFILGFRIFFSHTISKKILKATSIFTTTTFKKTYSYLFNKWY